MSILSPLAILTSFAAGIVSFVSPCVLPLVPGYVSYIGGRSLDGGKVGTEIKLATLGLSALFVLGFSTIFIVLGASATTLGRLLLSYRYEANLAGGTLVIAFGLLMIGLVRWSWFQRDFRLNLNLAGGRPVAAYVLGLAFAFGWTPCIGPVLGSILTVSAVSATVSQGVILLGAYSLGLGLPFLLVAMFTDRFFGGLKRMGRVGRSVQISSGVVMVGMGVAMITGYLTTLSYWLLETFPFFARIG